MGNANISYSPNINNIFCDNTENKEIINRIKDALKHYQNGNFGSCVAECRNIIDLNARKTSGKTINISPSDTQQKRFQLLLRSIDHSINLAHHKKIDDSKSENTLTENSKNSSDPKHEFNQVEAKCILAICTSMAELILNGCLNNKEENETKE